MRIAGAKLQQKTKVGKFFSKNFPLYGLLLIVLAMLSWYFCVVMPSFSTVMLIFCDWQQILLVTRNHPVAIFLCGILCTLLYTLFI